MRLLIEIFIVAALISLAWEKPLRDRLPAFLTGTKPETTKAALRLQTSASATPSGRVDARSEPTHFVGHAAAVRIGNYACSILTRVIDVGS